MKGDAFLEIPENPFGLSAGAVLEATEDPLTANGGSSLDFVIEQGGGRDTIIFLFGIRRDVAPLQIIEGVFLNEGGRGFHPTWGFFQLLAEVRAGGWTVIPRDEALAQRREMIELRMNRRRAR